MTDNEKRAHDIAVGAMIVAAQAKADEEGSKVIDLYKFYLSAYQSALKAVNRDFNNEKKS